MDERISAAIENNAALYEAVFRAHRLDCTRRDGMWLALDPAPAYYSDALVLSPAVTAADVFAALAGRSPAGVKDGFATLDLTPGGFRELFSATWIHRNAGGPASARTLEWRHVRARADLARYRDAHGTADSLHDRLLEEPDVTIALAERDGAAVAGVLFNRSGSHVGVSNVFAAGVEPAQVWSDLVALAAEWFPATALVGYESGPDLLAALDAGFRGIGPLKIWVK